jgi:hypothetical protein
LTLPPLSPEGVATLAAQAGRPAAELHRITAGNPFFVTELLASHDAAAERIPASVRDAVWSRLSRLSAGEREALDVISIVPGRRTVAVASASWGGCRRIAGSVRRTRRALARRSGGGDVPP